MEPRTGSSLWKIILKGVERILTGTKNFLKMRKQKDYYFLKQENLIMDPNNE